MSLRVLAIVAAACAFVLLARAAPETPLTNEDIVRMVAAGTGERDILLTIASRPEAFDLSDDMIDELKTAGVSSAIVTAMKRRHAELSPSPPPAPPDDTRKAPVVVTLNAGTSGSRTLKLPKWADEDVMARFSLPKENDQRAVGDIAVFVACVTAEHVPDLWRSKSPLGRDMTGLMRHEMLAFVPGETPSGTDPRLVLPEKLEARVEAGDSHDLVLGVAARIGDHWIQIAASKPAKVAVTPDSKPVAGRIHQTGKTFNFKVELDAPKIEKN